MILSRVKPALQHSNATHSRKKSGKDSKNYEQFEDYLSRRDYTGAITFLEVNVSCKGFSLFMQLVASVQAASVAK